MSIETLEKTPPPEAVQSEEALVGSRVLDANIDSAVDAIHRLKSGSETDEELIEAGLELAGLEGNLSVLTDRILENIDPEEGNESQLERDAIGLLSESTASVIAGIMSERSEQFTGKTVDYLQSSRRKRLVGRLAVVAAASATAYFSNKGIDSITSYIPSGGVLLAGAKLTSSKFALGLSSVLKDKASATYKQSIEAIPASRLDQINEEAANLPEEEADSYRQGMIAHEMVKPLIEDLTILAHNFDIRGGDHQELSRQLAERTTDFLRVLYGVDTESEGRRITQEAAKKTVASIVGSRGGVFGSVGSAVTTNII